jgi:putative NADH-flavin reductase
MSHSKVLVIFGSTGNQGGSVIDTVLAHPELKQKYALRGITRDANSKKSQALSSKGVEMVQADINDPASIAAAVNGAYGVFAMTDYWSILDKEKETSQGKAIVDACKSSGVKHLVWSSLPNVTKLSNGKYRHVAHFDAKAAVEEYAEETKGDLVVSYFMPAMFMEAVKQSVQKDENGDFSLSLPFPEPNIAWPLISPSKDTGKFVIGLFEAGERSNGVKVQGVSQWTTPNELVKTLQEKTGKKATFNSIDAKTYGSFLPENIRADLSEMMQWIGEGYYGKGSEKNQAESDKCLLKGSKQTSWEEFVASEF